MAADLLEPGQELEAEQVAEGAGSLPFAVAATDLTGDGRSDLAVARGDGVSVFLDRRAPAAATLPIPPFPDTGLGRSSAPVSVPLTNQKGSLPVVVSNVKISGTNAGDFAVSSNTCDSVDPGKSCAIRVTFTPTAVGIRSANLLISYNAAGSPSTVALSGRGVPLLSVNDVTGGRGRLGGHVHHHPLAGLARRFLGPVVHR